MSSIQFEVIVGYLAGLVFFLLGHFLLTHSFRNLRHARLGVGFLITGVLFSAKSFWLARAVSIYSPHFFSNINYIFSAVSILFLLGGVAYFRYVSNGCLDLKKEAIRLNSIFAMSLLISVFLYFGGMALLSFEHFFTSSILIALTLTVFLGMQRKFSWGLALESAESLTFFSQSFDSSRALLQYLFSSNVFSRAIVIDSRLVDSIEFEMIWSLLRRHEYMPLFEIKSVLNNSKLSLSDKHAYDSAYELLLQKDCDALTYIESARALLLLKTRHLHEPIFYRQAAIWGSRQLDLHFLHEKLFIKAKPKFKMSKILSPTKESIV